MKKNIATFLCTLYIFVYLIEIHLRDCLLNISVNKLARLVGPFCVKSFNFCRKVLCFYCPFFVIHVWNVFICWVYMCLSCGKTLPEMTCPIKNQTPPQNNAQNPVGNAGTSTSVGENPTVISQVLAFTISSEVAISPPQVSDYPHGYTKYRRLNASFSFEFYIALLVENNFMACPL